MLLQLFFIFDPCITFWVYNYWIVNLHYIVFQYLKMVATMIVRVSYYNANMKYAFTSDVGMRICKVAASFVLRLLRMYLHYTVNFDPSYAWPPDFGVLNNKIDVSVPR